jgi:hypothetical protein
MQAAHSNFGFRPISGWSILVNLPGAPIDEAPGSTLPDLKPSVYLMKQGPPNPQMALLLAL